jgi:hypothetical protein
MHMLHDIAISCEADLSGDNKPTWFQEGKELDAYQPVIVDLPGIPSTHFRPTNSLTVVSCTSRQKDPRKTSFCRVLA